MGGRDSKDAFDSLETRQQQSRTLIIKNKDASLLTKGHCRDLFANIRDYYGSGWVGPGLTRIFF